METRDLLSSVPIALDDPKYATPMNTALVISTVANGIVYNDVDLEGSSLSASVVANPAHGTLSSFNSNGTFTYTPTTSYVGFDTFTYTVSDGADTSNVATVSIAVGGTFGVQTNQVELASASPLHTGGLLLGQNLSLGNSLIYRSETSSPEPLVVVETSLLSTSAVPTGIDAVLTFNGTAGGTIGYSTSGLSAGNPLRFVLKADASGLATGYYAYTLTLTAHFSGSGDTTTTFSGYQAVVNRTNSEYGDGWWHAGLDRLVISGSNALLVNSDGATLYFATDGSGGFQKATGDLAFSTLVKNVDNTYTLTSKHGVARNFSTTGLLTSIVDRNDNTISFAYIDADGDSVADELSVITDPFGRETTLTYASGKLDEFEDFAGRVTSLEYTSGRLTNVTLPDPDAGGALAAPEVAYTYNSTHHLLETTTDPISRTTTYAFNSNSHRLSGITFEDTNDIAITPIQAIGLKVSGSINSLVAPSAAVGTITDERGKTTSYQTNRFGQVTQVTTPLGYVTTTLIDSRGLPYKITQPDPDGAGALTSPVTLLGYNTSGDNIKQVLPDGGTIVTTYDSTFHVPLTVTDQLSRVWTYTLDGDGNVTEVEDPTGQSWLYDYTAEGLVSEATTPDPDGGGALSAAVTTYDYDAYGRLETITNPDSSTRTIAYNSADRVTSVTDELSQVSYLTWDNLDRQTSATDAASGETDFEYDAANQLVSQTDALGNTTSFAYNDRGWLTSMVRPDPDGAGPLDGPETTYDYDSSGHRTGEGQLYYVSGSGMIWDYDDDGRMYREKGPLTVQTKTYTLDNLGRVTAATDETGFTTSYEYNALNQVTRITGPDPDGAGPLAAAITQFGYDLAGQKTSLTDPLGNVTTYSFTDLGQVERITRADPDGSGPMYASSVSYQYDFVGRLVNSLDQLWRNTAYAYNSRDLLVSVTQPGPGCAADGPETDYSYDSLGRVTDVTDPLGRVTSYSLDELGRVLSVTLPDPDGAGGLSSPVYAASYDLLGNRLTTTDPLGNVTSFGYDNLYRRTSVTGADPDGGGALSAPVTTWVYGSSGLLDSIVDPAGSETSYGYDNAGKMTSIVDDAGKTTTIGYGLSNLVTSVTQPDPDGGGALSAPQVAFTYDNMSRLKKITDPRSGEINFTYDLASNLLTVKDPANNTTTYAYDHLNRVTMETNALGKTRSYFHDGADNVTRRMDRNGRLIQLTYDELNRVTSEEWHSAGGNAPSITLATSTQGGPYSEVQRVGFTAVFITGGTFTLSFNGYTTGNIAYNASAATVKTALEGLTSIGSGNVSVTQTFNTGSKKEWQISFIGSLIGTNVAQTTINTTNITTGGGAPSNIQATDTTGGSSNEVQTITLNYTNDGTFRLALDGQVTPPLDFDSTAGEVETELEALSTIDNVTVTGSNGGPWTVTFGGSQAGVNVSSLQGDTANLVGGTLVRTINYTFDDASQLLSASDPDSAYAYTYDNLGRVTQIDNDGTPNSPNVVLDIGYDAASRRTSLTATIDSVADFVNTYSYDNLGRMTRVEQLGQTGGNDVAKKRVDFSYNAVGQFDTLVRQTKPSSTWNEVATSTYGYDSLHRLTSLDHTVGATDINNYTWSFDYLDGAVPGLADIVSASTSATPIVNALALGAIFAGAGRITQMTSADGTSNYTYDASSELTGADHDFMTDETYSFDANGNRSMTGYSTGTNNRLLDSGPYSYSYDDEGNRTVRTTDATGATQEYVWDYRNRLTKVTDKNSGGTTLQVVEYTYDIFNRRIGRAIDTTSPFNMADAAIERYSTDSGNVLLAFVDPDGTGSTAMTLDRRYMFGPAVDQVLAQEDVTQSIGGDDRVWWPLGDHLQTTRDLVDQVGATVEHYEFDSYGQVTAGDTSLTRYLFTAREFDAATGLQYSRMRYYDPSVARWIGLDTIGFSAGDPNLARYVANMPTMATDAFGLSASPLPSYVRNLGLANWQEYSDWQMALPRMATSTSWFAGLLASASFSIQQSWQVGSTMAVNPGTFFNAVGTTYQTGEMHDSYQGWTVGMLDYWASQSALFNLLVSDQGNFFASNSAPKYGYDVAFGNGITVGHLTGIAQTIAISRYLGGDDPGGGGDNCFVSGTPVIVGEVPYGPSRAPLLTPSDTDTLPSPAFLEREELWAAIIAVGATIAWWELGRRRRRTVVRLADAPFFDLGQYGISPQGDMT